MMKIKELKDLSRHERETKVPAHRRPLRALLFIDLQKAFDKVDRNLLMRKLNEKGVRPALTAAITPSLRNTSMKVHNSSVDTRTGVP